MFKKYKEILSKIGMPGVEIINESGEFIYNSNNSRGIYSTIKGNVVKDGVIFIESNIDIFSTSTCVDWLRVYNINNYSFHLQLDNKKSVDIVYKEIIESIKNNDFYNYINNIPRGVCIYSKESELDMINQLNSLGIVDVEFIGNFGSFVGKSTCSDFSYEGLIDEKGYFYLQYDLVDDNYSLIGDYNNHSFVIELDTKEDIKDLFRYLKEENKNKDIINMLKTLPYELCRNININSNKKLTM